MPDDRFTAPAELSPKERSEWYINELRKEKDKQVRILQLIQSNQQNLLVLGLELVKHSPQAAGQCRQLVRQFPAMEMAFLGDSRAVIAALSDKIDGDTLMVAEKISEVDSLRMELDKALAGIHIRD